MMPLTVVDGDGRVDGGIRVAHAKGGAGTDERNLKIIRGASHARVHQTFASRPLAGAAGLRRLHPEGNGEVVADAARNLHVTAGAIERGRLSARHAGDIAHDIGRAVVAVAAAVVPIAFQLIPRQWIGCDDEVGCRHADGFYGRARRRSDPADSKTPRS